MLLNVDNSTIHWSLIYLQICEIITAFSFRFPSAYITFSIFSTHPLRIHLAYVTTFDTYFTFMYFLIVNFPMDGIIHIQVPVNGIFYLEEYLQALPKLTNTVILFHPVTKGKKKTFPCMIMFFSNLSIRIWTFVLFLPLSVNTTRNIICKFEYEQIISGTSSLNFCTILNFHQQNMRISSCLYVTNTSVWPPFYFSHAHTSKATSHSGFDLYSLGR